MNNKCVVMIIINRRGGFTPPPDDGSIMCVSCQWGLKNT